MKSFFYKACIELTNRRFTSKLLRMFSRSKWSRPFVRSFAATFKLNEDEMERELKEYNSLHDLFIRSLSEGCRPVEAGEDIMVSPVDGVIAESGNLEEGLSFTVKGQLYTLEEMLGSKEAAIRYQNGSFIILYLSPRHYHRIHSPLDGEIKKQWTLGSRSYPVNNWGLLYGRRPLSRNYRIITEVKHGDKHVAIVKVGAMNINTIELTHPNHNLQRGEEIGYFSFGSTVVLLCEKGLILPDSIENKGEIKVGQQIARFL